MPEIQNLLKDVPQDIRYWLGSEKTTYFISALNQKLGLEGDRQRIIPRLLFRLETRNLLPQNFVSELSKELDKPVEELKPIIEEIKKNILLPIDADLFRWGVDIRQISASTAGNWTQTNRVEITPPPPAPEKPKVAPLSTPQSTIPQQTNTQAQHSFGAAQDKAPFMLYQKQEQKPIAESIKSRIVGEIEMNTAGKPGNVSVPARIEIGPEPEFPKVVHYSDFKTPVDNKGQVAVPATPPIAPKIENAPTEEVVDLSSFKPTEKSAPTNGPANAPKVQGNTLDLR